MNIIKLLIASILILPTLCFADTGFIAPTLINTNANPGFNTVNPERRRVAGSALILRANSMISDESIPVLEELVPSNNIFLGSPELVQPIVEKQDQLVKIQHINLIIFGY